MYATNNADDDRVNYWSNSLFDGSNSNTNQPKLATDNTDVARLILERADDVAAFRPLPQLNASISGRWSVQANTYDVWTSNVSGGLPPYDYYWYRKNSGSSSYTYVGNGTSYGQTVTVDMDLKLVVIDDVNNSFTDYHSVDAISSGGSGCGPFTCPQPKLVGETIPESYSLSNNYPNPFNPSTKISFALPEQSNVELTIYNTMGQLVSTLQNGSLGEGSYEITFDAGALPSGLYIARLSAIGSSGESFINEIKMQLVK
ncbi:MAG: T9SS C-terminal target domain-containing protein [Balneola sp.]|nr:MAG: T9SS C-terminal target domain-containing protein [Balneola sp.]